MLAAGGLRAASLAELISRSDAIVVGAQTSLSKSGMKGASFNLPVERVFKGTMSVGSWIAVTWDGQRGAGDWTGSPAQHGIWFLRQGTGGAWICMPAASNGNVTFFPELSLPISTGPLPAELSYDPASTSLTDQLVLEIAATQPRNPALILNLTFGINSASAVQALRYLVANRSGDLALVGMTGLIQRGDVPTLLQVEKSGTTLDAGSSAGSAVIDAVLWTFKNPDPAGVKSLGRMATAVEIPAKLQFAAANALRVIHTSDALPYLGRLLSSSSAQMRLCGALGIASFVNGAGIPTDVSHLNNPQPTPYYTADTARHSFAAGEDAPFIAYWQAWWQQHPELHAIQ